MGAYRWLFIFPLILFSVFSYAAADCPAGIRIPRGTYKPFYSKPAPGSPGAFDRFINIGGCEYKSVTGGAITPDDEFASIGDFVSTGNQVEAGIPPSVIKPTVPDDNPDNPDNPGGDSGDSGSSGGQTGSTEDSGTTGGASGGSSSLPSEPDFSIPDNADYAQLTKLYFSCSGLNGNYVNPHDSRYNPAVDAAYNAHADKCNAVYDKINNDFPVGGKFTLDKSSIIFLTKRFDGTMVRCTYKPHIDSDFYGKVLSSATKREVIQNPHFPAYDPSNIPLNYNYPTAQPQWVSTLCESVADRPDSVNDIYNGKPSENPPSDNPGTGTGNKTVKLSCPPGPDYYAAKCVGVLDAPKGQIVDCPPGIHESVCFGTGGSTSLTWPATPPAGTGGSGMGDKGDEEGGSLDLPGLSIPELSLAPLWNIWPSARDFTLSLPVVQCPVFNIEVYGQNYKIDAFCMFITPDIIAVIRAICILVASVISFIIVLRS